MKFYSAVEINGSAYVKVTTTNFLNVSSSGLFYNYENSYGDNYLSFYNNGLYINNSFSTGFNTFMVGNNQMRYYCYSSLGTGQFTATATSFTALISNGGNVSITNGGTEINDFSTSGNLNLTSSNAVRVKTGAYYAAMSTSLLASNRTYQFPNADGTIALTADIPDASKILMVKGYPPVGSNLNTFTTTGLYVFTTVPAEQSTNVPIAQAGVLEVIADASSGLIYQKYRATGHAQYKRIYGGSWGAWDREPNVGEIFKHGVTPYANLGFADSGVYFHSGSESDNPMPGYPGYSINKFYTGQYSFQMYAASSYGSGSSGYVDGLFWRSNNAGGTGSGWNTPWIQAASRDWVTSTFSQWYWKRSNAIGGDMNAFPRHGVAFVYAGTTNAPGSSHYMSLSIGLDNNGGNSTAQIAVDGANPDGFFYRASYETGGTWFQAASRSWIAAQGFITSGSVIQNQNSSAQSGYAWVSNTLRSDNKIISGGGYGFRNATYVTNVANPIWSFLNAEQYGMSYYQGTALAIGESIGFHFGNIAAPQAAITTNGDLVNRYTQSYAYVDKTSGITMQSLSGYMGFFTNTGLSVAAAVKAGSMVVSNAYADNAPTNGLFVRGASNLFGGLRIGSLSGPSTMLEVTGGSFLNGGVDIGDNAYYDSTVALSVKSNRDFLLAAFNASAGIAMCVRQNGNMGVGNVNNPTEKLHVDGSIRQTAVTSAILKADSNGKLVAAVAGTDFPVINTSSVSYTSSVGAVFTVTGNSRRGTITMTSNPGLGSGTDFITLSFGTSYSSAPRIILTPRNYDATSSTCYVSAENTTNFHLTSGNTGIFGYPSWNYLVEV